MLKHVAFRLDNVLQIATDVKAFELTPLDGGQLPEFAPGDHVDVLIEPSVIRQYSVCNRPGDRTLRLAVKLEESSKGGSCYMHSRQVGDVLAIGNPRNNFPLHWEATHHVLIAGGIGITPLLSMAHHLQARQRSIALHYFCRSFLSGAFIEEIHEELGQYASIHVNASPDDVASVVKAEVERSPSGTHLYTCGPVAMIDRVTEVAYRHLPIPNVHKELFGARNKGNEGHSQFRVRLARSGQTFNIQDGESIATVLRENAIDVPVSCQQGVCGSCLTRVVQGIPDHRDEVLSDEMRQQGDLIALCVSGSLSEELVLDL